MGIQRYTQNCSNNHLYSAHSIQVIFYWHFPLIAGSSVPRVLLSLSKPVPAYLWLKARSKEGFIRCLQWFLDQNPRLQSKNTLLNSHLTVKVAKFAIYLSASTLLSALIDRLESLFFLASLSAY